MIENNGKPPVKRKPGGQPGNQNARKHGLRSRKLTPVEREQLKIRVLLACLEKAADVLTLHLTFLTDMRLGKAAFVGNRTNTSPRTFAGIKDGVKPVVMITPSRLKGYLNLKTNVTLPVPEILASEAKMQDLIHQIKFFPHSTNDSPPADN
jgi:hypothetical protein